MVAGLVTGESVVVPDKMLEGMGVRVVRDEVIQVDPQYKSVFSKGGLQFDYDKLFLATGASPFMPPIEGCDLQGVMTLRGLDDAACLNDLVRKKEARNLIFIGAGFISMEVATLLADMSPGELNITIVELLDRPLPLMLDGDMASSVSSYLEESGLKILTENKVVRLLGDDGKVKGVELGSGEVLDGDLVFMNVGVRPNVELAEKIGLDIGQYGIKVNRFQETSDPDILAGGDCVEKLHFITGKPVAGQLRGPAVIQGRLAAKRLAGYDIGFPGVVDAGGCKMFDMTVTATGLTEESALREGYETVSAIVDSRSKHGMIPGMKPWKLKLVFDRKSTRLLGGQIVSHDVAPARNIDAVTAFILGGKTIAELTTFTSACNPDISSEPSGEPITIAAEQALQKLGQQ